VVDLMLHERAPVPLTLTSKGLDVRQLSVQFGGVHALRNVDLHLGPGDVLGLTGPNGSGKSTLFNAISGLAKATTGTISLDGSDVTRLDVPARTRRGVSRTFQTPRIDAELQVRSAVLCGYYLAARSSLLASLLGLERFSERHKAIRDACDHLLDRLGLTDVADQRLGTLSLGQVRLVDVARAMASGSRYLLLDEPAVGLTADEQAHLARAIRKLAEEGTAILLVEHNFALLSSLCERVVVLDRGSVLLQGPIAEVRRETSFVDAYLGSSAGTSAVEPVQRAAANVDAVKNLAPVLQCIDLCARYGQIRVIERAEITVARGETLVLLGLNGAGKTTLLNAIVGMVSHTGRIVLEGEDIVALRPHRRVARGVAFVPEVRANVFMPMTVDENLAIALRAVPRRDRDKEMQSLLTLFPILAERGRVAAGMLSGGEQQMLAIAIAVARKPAVLLLDEPTQGLAPAISLRGPASRQAASRRLGRRAAGSAANRSEVSNRIRRR